MALCTYFECLLYANYALVLCVYICYTVFRRKEGFTLPINYKIDVLEALKKAGYTTYRLRNEKIMGERVIQQLRQQELVSWKTIETICSLLGCQPGDLVEYTHGAE